MIKVHVWNFVGPKQAWGHASMHIGTEYISWWPESAGRDYKISTGLSLYSVSHIHGQSLDDDKRYEGRSPDHTVPLVSLDEPRILQWWRVFNARGRSWSTLGQNCSTTVARALMVGNGDDYAQGMSGWWHSWNTVWNPEDVLRYARAADQGLRVKGTRCFGINFVRRFCISPLAMTSLTWSVAEKGLPNALYNELGSNHSRVFEVFTELDQNRDADADDVAQIYLKLIQDRGGPALEGLKTSERLRKLLIEVMDEGWTTTGEKECIDYLKGLP